MTKRKPLGRGLVTVGDFVLLGRPGISLPADWWLGTVLWVGTDELLVEQYGIGGSNKQNQLQAIDYVRAIGTIDELIEIRHQAQGAIEPLKLAVKDAEKTLQDARDAVWQKLDRFADDHPLRNTGGGI